MFSIYKQPFSGSPSSVYVFPEGTKILKVDREVLFDLRYQLWALVEPSHNQKRYRFTILDDYGNTTDYPGEYVNTIQPTPGVNQHIFVKVED